MGPDNLPAERSTAERPPLLDAAADYDIPRLWCSHDERGKPYEIFRALTDGERTVVTRRYHELVLGCAPFTAPEQDRMIAAVSRMLAGFRSMRHDDDEVAVAGLDGLRHVLAPFPLWAIEQGCLAIQRGDAWLDGKKLDRRFPPNDSEVYGAVAEIVKAYAGKRDAAAALLAAPVKTPLRLAGGLAS